VYEQTAISRATLHNVDNAKHGPSPVHQPDTRSSQNVSKSTMRGTKGTESTFPYDSLRVGSTEALVRGMHAWENPYFSDFLLRKDTGVVHVDERRRSVVFGGRRLCYGESGSGRKEIETCRGSSLGPGEWYGVMWVWSKHVTQV